jgi:hypothetical protein
MIICHREVHPNGCGGDGPVVPVEQRASWLRCVAIIWRRGGFSWRERAGEVRAELGGVRLVIGHWVRCIEGTGVIPEAAGGVCGGESILRLTMVQTNASIRTGS